MVDYQLQSFERWSWVKRSIYGTRWTL